MVEPMRTWQRAGFRLDLFETNRSDWRGQPFVRYKFRHKGKLIFKGEDFSGSPMHSIDGDASVCAILWFLSMRPGDTDREYFDHYTARQLAWCIAYGEKLSCLVIEMESSDEDDSR